MSKNVFFRKIKNCDGDPIAFQRQPTVRYIIIKLNEVFIDIRFTTTLVYN